MNWVLIILYLVHSVHIYFSEEIFTLLILDVGEINKVGLHRKCEMCYPTCIEIQYYLDTTSLPIRRDVDLWKNKTSGLHEVWYTKI